MFISCAPGSYVSKQVGDVDIQQKNLSFHPEDPQFRQQMQIPRPFSPSAANGSE